MRSPARAVLPHTLNLICALALAMAAGPLAARCVDEDSFGAEVPNATTAAPMPIDPRVTLAEMVGTALERSQAVGASRMLAEAALDDVAETRAAKQIQGSLGGGLGPGASTSLGVTETSALQVRANVNISQLLYDGGRTDRLTDWRTQLAESARYGHLSQREQLALNTVALALERSRWRQQVVVYGQYSRKMGCLVEALETIVRADRGRASELVQARKTQQQADISQAQAQSQVRQVEVRLRRLLGDGLPGTDGLSTVLLQMPDFDTIVAEVERSNEIAQLGAQAAAAEEYARAVEAQNKAQVSWSFTGQGSAGTASGGNGPVGADGRPRNPRNGTVALGIQVSIPLFAPGLEPASNAAQKRALAAAMQRVDALEARRFRAAEVFEQTQSSFDRARRVGAVLRDSEQVRNFTLQQWQQLGKRSLFDVMGAEAEHYNLRVAYINALHDGQQLNANLLSLRRGVSEWLR
jgi:outer membrane protein, adhesin transport system